MTAAAYPCSRCGGSGRLPVHSNVLGGVCFACRGRGTQVTKPRAPSVRYAVFGVDRVTGERARLYNVTAKNPAAAIERARNTMAGASTAFKDQFTLADAVAIPASELH